MADPAIVEALLATDLFGSLDKKAASKLADLCSRVSTPPASRWRLRATAASASTS